MSKKGVMSKIAQAALDEDELPPEVDQHALQQVVALGGEYRDVHDKITQLEGELAPLKDREKQLREKELPESMRQAGMVNSAGKGRFTVPGAMIYLETKLHASVDKANAKKLFAFLRRRKQGAMVVETVNAMTLAAYVRGLREEGKNDPPGTLVYEVTKAKLKSEK